MFLIKKQEVVFAKEFLIDLQTLQRTEDEIHEFSKNNYRTGVVKKAEQRDLIARELKGSLLRLEEDIKIASKGKGPEDNFNFVKIKNFVYNIEDLLRKQLEELNKIEILEDHLARTMAIDGTNMSGESQLTYEIRKLRELLDSQGGVIVRYIVETEQELEKSQEISNHADNRPEEIKNRFIISEDGQTIYDNKTKLTWERDFAKSKKINWNNAQEYAKNNNTHIPTRADWKSLSNSVEFPLQSELEKIGFINVPNWSWISEPASDKYSAIVVHFSDGTEGLGQNTSLNYVVCVKQN